MEYWEHFLNLDEADYLKDYLFTTIAWEQHNQKMYNKMVVTPRLTACYDDAQHYESTDRKTPVKTWTLELLLLKQRIEAAFGYHFNGVLLNLYRNNNDSVTWHRDKKAAMVIGRLLHH